MTTVSNIWPNLSAWAATTSYSVGNRVSNDTSPVKAYQCITSGTSAGSGGPTGTGSNITDGGAHWKYLGSVDYTSVSGWITGMGTISGPQEGDVWMGDALANTAASITSTETINNGGTSATNTILLTAAAGESFQDNITPSGANALAYNAALGVAFSSGTNYVRILSINVNYISVTRLQFTVSAYLQVAIYGNMPGGSSDVALVDSCIFYNTSTFGSGDMVSFGGGWGTGCICQNCLFYTNGTENPSGYISFVNRTNMVINCTVARTSNNTASGTGMWGIYGSTSLTTENCAVFGFTTPMEQSGTTTVGQTDYCATDQSSLGAGTNTNGVTSVAFSTATFKAVGSSPDFRLVTGSALVNAGKTSYAPAKDILGQTRPTGTAACIGCVELAASGDVLMAQAWM